MNHKEAVDHSPSRFSLDVALCQAIEQDALLLHYQPKIDSRTGRVEGVEALVRWQHPERGLLPPAEFIPLAEEAGLIKRLTWWVLGEALRQCAWWQEAGVDVRVAVNISTQMLHDRELVAMTTDLLERTGVGPTGLAMEITETAPFADSARAQEALARLHEMGVRIAIDDFGTGYASLAYLRLLTVDEIKIDKSFVIDILENNADAFITQAVIDLGHNLGLEVVAEGIEDEETWDRLAAMGCDQVQGYYLSHPIPATEFTSWLDGASRRAAPLERERSRGRSSGGLRSSWEAAGPDEPANEAELRLLAGAEEVAALAVAIPQGAQDLFLGAGELGLGCGGESHRA